jgi:hypothetical protein
MYRNSGLLRAEVYAAADFLSNDRLLDPSSSACATQWQYGAELFRSTRCCTTPP